MQFGLPEDKTSGIRLMGEYLERVICFKYVDSNISANCNLDDEIHYPIEQVPSASGRLNKRGLTNHDLKLKKTHYGIPRCLNLLLVVS